MAEKGEQVNLRRVAPERTSRPGRPTVAFVTLSQRHISCLIALIVRNSFRQAVAGNVAA
jgi:hypothetical protein